MESIVLRLPFPPSTNNLFSGRIVSSAVRARTMPAPARSGGRVLSVGYRRWRRLADTMVMMARPGFLDGPVEIEIVLHPRPGPYRDADNYVKALLDCLVRMRVISTDDRRVVRKVSVAWGAASMEPEAVISVTPLGVGV